MRFAFVLAACVAAVSTDESSCLHGTTIVRSLDLLLASVHTQLVGEP